VREHSVRSGGKGEVKALEGQVEPTEDGPSLLPQLRLDDLLAELQVRLAAVVGTRDRVHALLDAVVAVGSNLELEFMLRQIVEAAVTLVNARYGAIAVIGEGGQLAEFVPVGLADAEIARIHHWPEGRGLLRELITEPRPLRLPDMSAHPHSYGLPEGHPPMTTFLGAPVRIRDEVFGNLYLTEKTGGAEFDEEDEAVLVALAAAAGIAIGNARLYAEARRQQQWLRASGEVTQRLLSEADAAEVLALVARQALEISGADLVVLAFPVGDGRQLVIEHAAGEGAEEAIGLVLPAARSASGIVLASGKPLSLDDFSSDERAAPAAREHLHLGPAVVVPLGAPGNVRAILTAGRRQGAMPLAPPAVEMLISFAAQAAVGLELAVHRRDAERLAIFEDRDRIARDLHDLVIQRLYATGMSLQSLSTQMGEPENARRVDSAVDALDQTIKDIRSAIFTLHSRPASNQVGLRARIVEVADQEVAALGFAPALRMSGYLDEQVPAGAAEHLISALREALSNAARHAGASKVDVTAEAGAELILVVTDNGTGMKDAGRSSGLANLADRAAQLGGTMSTRPADGGGTTLEWRVPLQELPLRRADGEGS
jgi:signal transduction histidine kinase